MKPNNAAPWPCTVRAGSAIATGAATEGGSRSSFNLTHSDFWARVTSSGLFERFRIKRARVRIIPKTRADDYLVAAVSSHRNKGGVAGYSNPSSFYDHIEEADLAGNFKVINDDTPSTGLTQVISYKGDNEDWEPIEDESTYLVSQIDVVYSWYQSIAAAVSIAMIIVEWDVVLKL